MRNAHGWQRFFVVTVAATMALICVDVVAQEEATLTHRYNFENDTADDTVDAVNGTLMGAPVFTDDAPAGNRSILLDGDAQYIDYPDPMDFTKQFSIVAWVKPDPAGVNIQTIVANAQGGWATDGFKLFFNTWTEDGSVNDGRILLQEGNGGEGMDSATDVDALVMDEWNQVVTTVDLNGTEGVMTYVNGVKLVDAGPVIADMNTNLPWTIGTMPARDGIGADWTWMGGIDDVQIYDGLLTNEEAQWLFDNPGGAIGIDPPTTLLGDVNLDGVVNGLDVDPFVAAVVGGAQSVPEPSTLLLCIIALGVVGGWWKWGG
jgi:hypothetical protein